MNLNEPLIILPLYSAVISLQSSRDISPYPISSVAIQMRSKVFRVSADAADRRCFYYFLMAVIVIRHETAATARWTLPFIFRAFFNDTITVAVRTGFHVRLMHMLPHPSNGRAAMGGMMRGANPDVCFG